MEPKINRNYTESSFLRDRRALIPGSTLTAGMGDLIEWEEVTEEVDAVTVTARTIQEEEVDKDLEARKEFIRYAMWTVARTVILPVLGVVLIGYGIASALVYLSAYPLFWYAVLGVVLVAVVLFVVRVTVVRDDDPEDLPGWKGSRKKQEVNIVNNVTIKNEIQC